MTCNDNYGMIAGHYVHKETYDHYNQTVDSLTNHCHKAQKEATMYKTMFWIMVVVYLMVGLLNVLPK